MLKQNNQLYIDERSPAMDDKFKVLSVKFVKDLALIGELAKTDPNVATDGSLIHLSWKKENIQLLVLIDPPENELTISIYNDHRVVNRYEKDWKSKDDSYQAALALINELVEQYILK